MIGRKDAAKQEEEEDATFFSESREKCFCRWRQRGVSKDEGWHSWGGDGK